MKGQLSRQMDGIIFLLPLYLQGHREGVHGPAEPRPLSAVQHAAPPDPRPVDPEEPHPLQHDHARLRLARHRRLAHRSSGDSPLLYTLAAGMSTTCSFCPQRDRAIAITFDTAAASRRRRSFISASQQRSLFEPVRRLFCDFAPRLSASIPS